MIYKRINPEPCSECGQVFCPGKHTQTERDQIEEIREATKTLIDAINKLGNGKAVGNAIAQELLTTHRTLQQEFLQTIVGSYVEFMQWQNTNGFKDLRNEASCEICEKIAEILKENPIPFI